MRLQEELLNSYQENGFVFLPSFFSQDEVEVLKAELPLVFQEDVPGRVIEKNGSTVRSIYGSHKTNEVYYRLTRHPRIVEPAVQMLGSEVYVYQFKINAKAAFEGDIWQWHQDYIFWLKEDGLPTVRVTNALIYLDEVNEFNGPFLLIPGSHKEGCVEVPAQVELAVKENGYENKGSDYSDYNSDSPSWLPDVTANLKYSLDRETVARLVTKNGIVAPKGPAGSALFFHPNLVHASTNNISPFNRTVVIVTYNSIDNIPIPLASPRPDFLVNRDFEPVTPLSDDVLLARAIGR